MDTAEIWGYFEALGSDIDFSIRKKCALCIGIICEAIKERINQTNKANNQESINMITKHVL